MRKSSTLSLVLVMLFMFSLVDLTRSGVPAADSELLESLMDRIQFADVGDPYTGTGSPLSVSFTGTFINSTGWSASSNTLSKLLTPGSSFSVENSTTVTWTTYVLVAPPADVDTLSFSVDYPQEDWYPVSVTDPLGTIMTNPTDWHFASGVLTVEEAAVANQGLWKLVFSASNHLDNLLLGNPLSTTGTFDTSSTIKFQTSSSWITGASAEFVVTDPTGTEWSSPSNTTVGTTTHLLSAFKYRKNLTISSSYVYGDKTDFPVLIDITDSDLQTDVQSSGNDILFVSGSTILSHEIELFDQSTGHLVTWVKADLSGSSTTVITMYYGNPDIGPLENPIDVWTNNFLAAWHLGEDVTDGGTSGIHYDSTSGDYYGNQDGNVEVGDLFGYSQQFSEGDQIVVDAARGLEPSGSATISGWFKLDSAHSSTSRTQVIMTKALSSNPGNYDFHIALKGTDYSGGGSSPTGSMVLKVEYNANREYVWTSQTSWSADQWYFFVITLNAGNPQANRIYIDGTQDFGGQTYTGTSEPLGFVSFADDWVIGGGFMDQMVPTYGNFTGTIDEVRISSGIRDSNWIATEYSMNPNDYSSFVTKGTEVSQGSPDLSVSVPLNSSAPAGVWTVTVHYNDSSSFVDYRVGEYSRNFLVQRASSLTVTDPSDAAAGLASLTVGDLLYLVVDLQDSGNSQPITDAEVSMNWTASTIYFEDLGDGRYSIARNTSQLDTRQRWHIDITATHSYFVGDTTSFDLDLFHPTQLTYEWVESVPVGFKFNATLVFRDYWDGSLISGATITESDGTPVTAVPWGAGRYNITMDTSGLSSGNYWFMFNASNPSGLYRMASVNITYNVRPHFTAASVSGDLLTPYGEDTTINVILIDLDTGEQLTASVVSSLTFTPDGYAPQQESSPGSLTGLTLNTATWSGTVSVDLTFVISDSDYSIPDVYTFSVDIRNHKTSVYVTGDFTTAYGADTPLTVVITDLDGGTVDISDVVSFTFISSQGAQVNSSLSSFTLDLKTNTWPVSTIQVTVSVVMSGNFDNPSNYIFFVTIRSLHTTLYNAPSNLVFTQGSDFTVDVHFNVSETGQYYGWPIDGEAGQFVVTPYGANVTPLVNGMYRLSISWSFFNKQGTDFTINVAITPSSNLYSSANLVISFHYRAIDSDLTANLYTISTPYNMDVTIHLYFTDRDSGIGITTATIDANSTINSQSHIANGDYLVELDVSSFGIGSYDVNLTASAAGYDDKWVIVTIIVTKIHTDAEPTTIRLEIPSGNSKIFYVDWTDLDNSLPLQATFTDSNWTGAMSPTISWTGSRHQITFTADSSDMLGTFLVWFNFGIDDRYENGTFEIQIEIRSHDTILTVESPPPTAINALINITVYYYDFDYKVGIDSGNVDREVYESGSPVVSLFSNLGNGYYLIQIDAGLFDIGLFNFTINLNWTGVIQQYEDKTVFVSVSIVGVESQMVLISSAEPTPYLDTMTYVFVYNEKDSGQGITNLTNNVVITVSFTTTFDPAKVTISEVNRALYPGRYQVVIDTTGFDNVGQFSMTIDIDWVGGDPFYNDRSDIVAVKVLARDTVLLVDPPSPVSYGEDTVFTFTWQDTALGTNILESLPNPYIASNVTFLRSETSGTFTITVDTSQFATIGSYGMSLSVSWAGSPFYSNRTTNIRITVLSRLTVLDYPAPDPTFYSDNVTITVTWTDVTGGGSDPVTGGTVTVRENSVVISSDEYSFSELAGGIYVIEFNTSRFSQPDTIAIEVQIHVAATYILDKIVSRNLVVRERRTILSYEAIGSVAYGEPIEFTLFFEDLLTLTPIGNATGAVSLDILTPGYTFSSSWDGLDYTLTISGYPILNIGETVLIQLNMTYAFQAPFYASDDLWVSFELRARLSLLSIEEAPSATPYLDWTNFTLRYTDVDGGYGIPADYFEVYYGPTLLTFGTSAEYFYTDLTNGYYDFSVNSTVFGGLGLDSIKVDAYWTSGPDYHNNASRIVSFRVTTRDTILDLVNPPSQTKFLNNMTLAFRYLDLFRNQAINSISASDITIYVDGTPLIPGEFILVPVGETFQISINSTILGATLGTYNVTVLVVWPGGEPHYVDASVESFVTTTNREISFAASPIEEAPFGNLLNISFRLTDAGRGWLLDLTHVTLTFDAQNPSITLVEGVDYDVYPNNPNAGWYTIRIDTNSLGTPGSVFFELQVNWNQTQAPYYANTGVIVLEGVIGDLETELLSESPDSLIEIGWTLPADVYVDYRSILYGNFTSGATVTFNWAGGQGTLTEFGVSGRYFTSLDTSLVNAGTYIVTLEAVRPDYAVARTYVTLVVTPIPSEIQVIAPIGEDQVIPRGSAVAITVYMFDTTNSVPINSSLEEVIYCRFQSVTYDFIWNGTEGYYEGLIPAGGPTDLPEDSYTIIVRAEFTNYAPSSYVISINTIQSRTLLTLTGDTEEEMSIEYTGLVIFTVNLTTPDFGNALFSNANVSWRIDENDWSGVFVLIGPGLFEAVVNTTDLGYGIWPVSIKARMSQNVTLFSDSSTQLTLTITRIETTVTRPSNIVVAWGWQGELAFIYNGTYGPISGATVTSTGTLVVGAPEERPGGVYVITIDTRLAVPGTFSINVLFSKANYQEAPSQVQFTVREVQTTIYPHGVEYTPSYVGTVTDILNLQIPIGDSMVIDFYFNDTDSENQYVGGLSNAYATINSYLRGPSIEGTLNVTILDFGGGLYRVVFDTMDDEINAVVDDIELYSFYIEMKLDNHSAAEVTFKIEVINIATSLEINNVPTDWTIVNGDDKVLELRYFDTWHGVGVAGASLHANVSQGAPFSVIITEGTTPGIYYVEIVTGQILFSNAFGTLTITINKASYNIITDSNLITVLQNPTDTTLTTVVTFGIPGILIVSLLGILYLRVLSVPKRLRQINSQIKVIRKGKVPKPVGDAKSRQEIITDLFNDTYEDLGITRTKEQMPEESIPVEVPELGELLIQLAILTNLNQQELDEFKADIAKMKMSEQAAFVKEVIMQEAIRAARREGKSVDEVLDELQKEATQKLVGEKARDVAVEEEEEPEEEPVFLPSKEKEPEPEQVTAPEEPIKPAEDEEIIFTSDKMSPFEIDELRKELIEKGVPISEIDIILKQAEELPRELIEELIRSLDAEKLRGEF
jgi:hypothetical protein